MKECKSCKSELKPGATKCPHCGTDQRNWFKRHPIVTGILIFFLVVGIIGAAGGDSGEKQSSTTPSSQQTEVMENETDQDAPTPTTAQVEEVDLKVLMDAFDENQLAAEETYKDKLIQVTGRISNIAEDIGGTPYVSLKHPTDDFSLTSLKCSFKDKSAITSLKKDASVTLQGIVDEQTIGVIALHQCVVVE